MSGLEIVGAASAVLGFVETAISLLGRLRQAYDRQTELSTVFNTYNRELTSTQNIIKIVRDEQALQTVAVASELQEMSTVLERLVDVLRVFNDQKSSIRDTVEDLGRAKLNLMLRIQAAHVGLTRSLDNNIAVNTNAVERVNSLLEPVLGEGRGLHITNLLRDRHTRGDGIVMLNDADVASLQNEPTKANPYK
ncbi:uncharacterized protein FFMR_09008 [Fusarium fujikuroi]|nr:uncharacterized protein FFMR_09008 [Fusarium fujikuroi]